MWGKSDEDVCGWEEKERNMWGKSDEDICGREEKERNMLGKSDEDVDGRRRKGICGERVMRMWTGVEGKEYVGRE